MPFYAFSKWHHTWQNFHIGLRFCVRLPKLGDQPHRRTGFRMGETVLGLSYGLLVCCSKKKKWSFVALAKQPILYPSVIFHRLQFHFRYNEDPHSQHPKKCTSPKSLYWNKIPLLFLVSQDSCLFCGPRIVCCQRLHLNGYKREVCEGTPSPAFITTGWTVPSYTQKS